MQRERDARCCVLVGALLVVIALNEMLSRLCIVLSLLDYGVRNMLT